MCRTRAAVAATASGYEVMPGGLTYVTSESDTRFIAMQRGGSSKDTWIVSDEPVGSYSLVKPMIGKADLVRSGSNLSSRVVVMSPRPGRIERVIDVRMPRPRGLDARRSREFADIAQAITDIFLARGVLHGAGQARGAP